MVFIHFDNKINKSLTDVRRQAFEMGRCPKPIAFGIPDGGARLLRRHAYALSPRLQRINRVAPRNDSVVSVYLFKG
jgi:hypothetical protein